MDQAWGHAAGDAAFTFDATVPLAELRAELAEIEAFDRQVADLTATLRARLPAEEFRLVWALKDVVECRTTAEFIVHDRWLAGRLARLPTTRSAGLEAIRRDLLGGDFSLDKPANGG